MHDERASAPSPRWDA